MTCLNMKQFHVATISFLIFALTLSFGTGSKIPRVGRSRTYVQLRCGGIYDQQIFAKLEKVCDDCFNLYKDPEVHGLCRRDCFYNQTFKQCMNDLLYTEEEKQEYEAYVDTTSGRR